MLFEENSSGSGYEMPPFKKLKKLKKVLKVIILCSVFLNDTSS